MKDNAIQKNRTLRVTFILIMLAWYIMPIAKVYVRDAPAMLFGLIGCVLLFSHNQNCIRYIFSCFGTSALLAIAISMITYGGSTQVFFSQFIHLILFFLIPTCIAIYCIDELSQVDTMRIYWGLVLIFAIVFLSTFRAVLIDPYAARALTSSSASEEQLLIWKMNNVGGFSVTYAFGVVCILITQMRWRHHFVRILLFSCMLIFFVMAQFTTLLLILGVTLIISSLMKVRNRSNKLIIFTFLAIILFLLCFSGVSLGSIFTFFAKSVSSPSLSRRLGEIGHYFNTGNIGVSMGSRLECYQHGWECFLQSPLWGNSIEALDYYSSWHSTVFEIMGKVGLIGIALYLQLFRKSIHTLRAVGYQYYDWRVLTAIIYVICLAILNPIHYSHEISIALFTVYPIVLKVEDNKNGTLEN